MLRKLIRKQIRIVRDGGDPIGVVFDPKDVVQKVGSGNYYREPA